MIQVPRSVVDPLGRNLVGDQGQVGNILEPTGTGPSPVLGAWDEPVANRIQVQVVDHPEQRLRLLDVSIKTAPGLPAESLGPLAASARDAWQPFRGVFAEVTNGLATYRLLDGFSN